MAQAKKIKVIQTGSPIGRREYQEQTLNGLGLGKRHREKLLDDTPAVRGMIKAVEHLVKVEEVK
jgi:large subunit ribosomal protein L30